MRLTVKTRIAIALGVVLLAGAGTVLFATIMDRRAIEAEGRARQASAFARAADVASSAVTRVLADAGSLSFALRHAEHSEEVSLAYGWMRGSDLVAQTAFSRLEGSLPPTRSVAILSEWDSLRSGIYTWVNAESEVGDSGIRMAYEDDGGLRSDIRTNIPVSGSLQGLSGATLREAVRRQVNLMTSGTLRMLAIGADEQAEDAQAAALEARRIARDGTFGLVVLTTVLAAAAAVWLYRTIALPLAHATTFAWAVAGGDEDARMDRHTDDEIGVLTHAVEDMHDSLVRRVNVMRELAGAVIVNADGVDEAAQRVLVTADQSERSAGASVPVEEMRSIAAHAAVLKGLASQMIASQGGPR